MQTIFLTYYQRVILTNMIGAHSVNGLREAAVLLRVIERIRLTDKETIESGFEAAGAQIAWKLPEPGYGDKVVELENEEAKALIGAVQEVKGIRVVDAQWLVKVVAELEPEPVAAGRADGVQP
jgi:hypothetical protein